MTETSPTDHDSGAAMGVHRRIESLQGGQPMLSAPAGGICRVDSDPRDPRGGGHRREPVTELRGRQTRYGAPEPFPPCAAAHGFPAGGAGVLEAEVFDADRGTPGLPGCVEQPGDHMPDLGITMTGGPVDAKAEAARDADPVAVRIDHRRVDVPVIEIDPEGAPSPEHVARHRRCLGVAPGCVSRYQRPRPSRCRSYRSARLRVIRSAHSPPRWVAGDTGAVIVRFSMRVREPGRPVLGA